MNLNRGNNLLDLHDIFAGYSNLRLGSASKLNQQCAHLNSKDSNFIIDSLSLNNQTKDGLLKINSSNRVVVEPSDNLWFFESEQSNISLSTFNYSTKLDGSVLKFYGNDNMPYILLEKSNIPKVIQTGNYNDLEGKPTLSNLLFDNSINNDFIDTNEFSSSKLDLNDFMNKNECLLSLGLDSNISKLDFDISSDTHHIPRLLTSNLEINNTHEGFAYLNIIQSNEFSSYSLVDSKASNLLFTSSLPEPSYSSILIENNEYINNNIINSQHEKTFSVHLLSNYFTNKIIEIESKSSYYKSLIQSNISTVTSNINLYLKKSSNLLDISNKDQSVSNLGLDLFTHINYCNDTNSIDIQSDFVLKVRSNPTDKLYFDFLNDLTTDIDTELNFVVPCLTSNINGIQWKIIAFSNSDLNLTFTQATSNQIGMIKIDYHLTSNDDTIPNFSVVSSQVSDINTLLDGIQPLVNFAQFLSNNEDSDPNSNMLQFSSNLFEIHHIMKSNTDGRRQQVYNNLKLHPISYTRTADELNDYLDNLDDYFVTPCNDKTTSEYSNLSNKPTSLSCFRNDAVYLSKNKFLSECRDSSDVCRSNLNMGTIATQNIDDLNIEGETLRMIFLSITDNLNLTLNNEIFRSNYTLLQASNDNTGSAQWANMYEFTHDSPDTPGIVYLLESTEFNFDEPIYDNESTYTTKVLYNVQSNFQITLSNINNDISFIKNYIPAPKNFYIEVIHSYSQQRKNVRFIWNPSEQFFSQRTLEYKLRKNTSDKYSTLDSEFFQQGQPLSTSFAGTWDVYATSNDTPNSPFSIPFTINQLRVTTTHMFSNCEEKGFKFKLEIDSYNIRFQKYITNTFDLAETTINILSSDDDKFIEINFINVLPNNYDLSIDILDNYGEYISSNFNLYIKDPSFSNYDTNFTLCNLDSVPNDEKTFLKFTIEADVNGRSNYLQLSNITVLSNNLTLIDTNDYQISNFPNSSNYEISFSVSNELQMGTYVTNLGVKDDWGYSVDSNITLDLHYNFDTFDIELSNNRTAEIIPVNGHSLSNHYNWFNTFSTSNIQLDNSNYYNCNVDIIHYNSNGFKTMSNLIFTIQTPTMQLSNSTVYLLLSNNTIIASNINSFDIDIYNNSTFSNQFEIALYSNNVSIETKVLNLSNIKEFETDECVFEHSYTGSNMKLLYDEFTVFGKVIDKFDFSNVASNLQTFDTLYFSIQDRNIVLDSLTTYDKSRSYQWNDENNVLSHTSNILLNNLDSNYTCTVIRSNIYDVENSVSLSFDIHIPKFANPLSLDLTYDNNSNYVASNVNNLIDSVQTLTYNLQGFSNGRETLEQNTLYLYLSNSNDDMIIESNIIYFSNLDFIDNTSTFDTVTTSNLGSNYQLYATVFDNYGFSNISTKITKPYLDIIQNLQRTDLLVAELSYSISNINEYLHININYNSNSYEPSNVLDVRCNVHGNYVVEKNVIFQQYGIYDLTIHVIDAIGYTKTLTYELDMIEYYLRYSSEVFSLCNLDVVPTDETTFLKIDLSLNFDPPFFSNITLSSNYIEYNTSNYSIYKIDDGSNYELSFSVSNNIPTGSYYTSISMSNEFGYILTSNTNLELQYNFDDFHIQLSNNRTAEIISTNEYSLSNHYNWFNTFSTSNIQLDNSNYYNCNVDIDHYNLNGFKLTSNLTFSVEIPSFTAVAQNQRVLYTSNDQYIVSNINVDDFLSTQTRDSNTLHLFLYSNDGTGIADNIQITFSSNDIIEKAVFNSHSLYDRTISLYGYIIDSYDFSNEISYLSNVFKYPSLSISFESLYSIVNDDNRKTFSINYVVTDSNDSYDITLSSNVLLQSNFNLTENSNFVIQLDQYHNYDFSITMNDVLGVSLTSNLIFDIIEPVILYPETYFTFCNLDSVPADNQAYLKLAVEVDANGRSNYLQLSNLILTSNYSNIDINDYQISNIPYSSNYEISFSVSNDLPMGAYITNVGIIDDWGYSVDSNITLELQYNFDTFHIELSNNRTAEIIPTNGFSLSNHYNWFNTFSTSNIQLDNSNYYNCNVDIVHYNLNGFKLTSNLTFSVETPSFTSEAHNQRVLYTSNNQYIVSNINVDDFLSTQTRQPSDSNTLHLFLYSNISDIADEIDIIFSNNITIEKAVFNSLSLYDTPISLHGYINDGYDFSNEMTYLSNVINNPSLTTSIESLYSFDNHLINQKTFAINYNVTNSNENYNIILNSNSTELQSYLEQTENSNFKIVLDEYRTHEFKIIMNDFVGITLESNVSLDIIEPLIILDNTFELYSNNIIHVPILSSNMNTIYWRATTCVLNYYHLEFAGNYSSGSNSFEFSNLNIETIGDSYSNLISYTIEYYDEWGYSNLNTHQYDLNSNFTSDPVMTITNRILTFPDQQPYSNILIDVQSNVASTGTLYDSDIHSKSFEIPNENNEWNFHVEQELHSFKKDFRFDFNVNIDALSNNIETDSSTISLSNDAAIILSNVVLSNISKFYYGFSYDSNDNNVTFASSNFVLSTLTEQAYNFHLPISTAIHPDSNTIYLKGHCEDQYGFSNDMYYLDKIYNFNPNIFIHTWTTGLSAKSFVSDSATYDVGDVIDLDIITDGPTVYSWEVEFIIGLTSSPTGSDVSVYPLGSYNSSWYKLHRHNGWQVYRGDFYSDNRFYQDNIGPTYDEYYTQFINQYLRMTIISDSQVEYKYYTDSSRTTLHVLDPGCIITRQFSLPAYVFFGPEATESHDCNRVGNSIHVELKR
jgi:hypothetical protein